MKPRRPQWMFSVLIAMFMLAGCSAEIIAKPETVVKPKHDVVSSPIRVDHVEGSGNPMDWSDDEDFVAEGSGSGDDESLSPIQAVQPMIVEPAPEHRAPPPLPPTERPITTSTTKEPKRIEDIRATSAPSLRRRPPPTTTTSAAPESAYKFAPLSLIAILTALLIHY